MTKREIVRISIGILKGRECILLKGLSMSSDFVLTLELTVQAAVVREFVKPAELPADRDNRLIPFILVFKGVGAVRTLELETWECLNQEERALIDSCFEEVLDSPWISELHDDTGEYQPMVKMSDRHWQLLTYDHVIDVIASSFEFELDNQRLSIPG